MRKLLFACIALLLSAASWAQNTFPSSGNVGIGTTNPQTPLHVSSGQTTQATVQSTNAGAFAQYRLVGDGHTYQLSVGGSGTGTWANKLYVFDETASAARFAIDSSGNVGIGTTSPLGKLQVAGSFNSQGTGIQDGNDRPSISITGYYPQLVLMAGGAGNANHGSTISLGAFDSGTSGTFKSWTIGTPGFNATYMDIGFGTSTNPHLNGISGYGLTVMRLTNSGNVGIGTLSPAGKLEITANSSSSEHLVLQDTSASGHAPSLTFNALGLNGFQDDLAQIRGGHMGTWTANGYLAFLTQYDHGSGLTERMRIDNAGNVGIGTANPTYPLTVSGTVRAKEVIVDTGWSDYVFADDYKLPALSETEAAIKSEKHLPGIPSAKDVAEHGISVGEMQAKLLAKIEELTLHQIEQEKKLSVQSERLEAQAARIERLEDENASLKSTH